MDFINFYLVFFYFYSNPCIITSISRISFLIPRIPRILILISRISTPILCIPTLFSAFPTWFPAFPPYSPHSPHFHPYPHHSHPDAPHYHPDSLHSHHSPHPIPWFPIPAFTDSLFFICLYIKDSFTRCEVLFCIFTGTWLVLYGFYFSLFIIHVRCEKYINGYSSFIILAKIRLRYLIGLWIRLWISGVILNRLSLSPPTVI